MVAVGSLSSGIVMLEGADGEDDYLDRAEEGQLRNSDDPQRVHEMSGYSLRCQECNSNAFETGTITAESSVSNKRRLLFRSLRPSDKSSIKALHEDWFPVRYKDDFYECVVHNRMAGTDDPLFSCVAYTVEDDCGWRGRSRQLFNDSAVGAGNCEWGETETHVEIKCTEETESGCRPQVALGESSALIPSPGDDAFLDDAESSFQMLDDYADEVERIVGCVVGSFLDAERCNSETTNLLLLNPSRHSRLFYIMTLGTISEYRKQGLGSALVEKCLHTAEKDTKCGVVYLHVITFNIAAINFYEKLGFYRVKEIKDYYSKRENTTVAISMHAI
eukprot:CAMPEP_0197445296 /NCGR_PEP_ID=MMETSP1175-20131217/10549_1 /TAXON_ID=1003142 /ORGANISM="Triceratium dubium, Strain CCMP147" /LENGTH=331 /DNA_ID=CAMNT_0042976231 /DNA_START=206 /DNA_END=1202 /DNA_ORIENTATION=+